MAENAEQIKTYVMTTQANVKRMCSGCLSFRPVWVGETFGGDTVTVCGTCQRVLRRQRTAEIPPLSVNQPPSNPCGTESTGDPQSAPRASTDTVLASALPSPTASLGDAPRAVMASLDRAKAAQDYAFAIITPLYQHGEEGTSYERGAKRQLAAAFLAGCDFERAAAGVGGAREHLVLKRIIGEMRCERGRYASDPARISVTVVNDWADELEKLLPAGVGGAPEEKK